ncbi:hypothetical protein AAFC00_000208 [Neodothiora populina]|uniref:Protein CASP n=1 Tax=Neodothiora populina TaxID=2781224 RepID=A0ABR3P1Z7_9PEZI
MSAEAVEAIAGAAADDVEQLPKVNNASEEDASSKPGEENKENKFQQAIASWRSLDLTNLVSALDTAASDLVSHQRDALVQRKELAQKTKDFRKLDDSGKLGEIKAILKSYQSFIDLITNQSKATQAAFLQVYSPLSEAPDPYPLLEASVDSIIKSEEVIPKLESENKHLQNTVAKLSQQLEDQEKQLEQERTTRQFSATSQDQKIKEIEESWGAVLKEKQDNWEAREKSLEEKVENQDRLLKELKASYEVSQRMDKAEEDGQDRVVPAASAAELEILNSELDRTQQRLADLEARNEQLRLDLAQSTARAGESIKSGPVEDEPAFLRLRSENSALMRKLEALRYEKDSDKGKQEGNLRTFEREIAALKEDRETLKRKVDKMADYDEVKQELEMLKSIEFATGDADGSDAEDTAASNGAADGDKAESLEKLLLSRNKKLSNEMTVLRVSHNDLQARLESLQEELSNTNMELERSRNLNAQLENDLHATQQEALNAFDSSAMSVAGTYTSRYPKSSYAASTRRGGASSPTSSIISGFDASHSPRALDNLRGAEASPGAGILPMVTAQRDRFKKKIAELESEQQKQHTVISELRSEISSLQKDNLSLYEKTRYVNSYNRGPATSSSSSAYATNPNPSAIQIGDSTDRYRSAYEANISPFAAFRGRESARAFKRMSLPERAIFQVTRMVLATRTSRNLFAGYCVALHILVFVMLFSMGPGVGDGGVHQVAAAAAAGAAAAAAPGDGAGSQGGSNWVKQDFHDTQ